MLNPKVALLSYSTKGSGSGETVDTVRQAVEILKERNVDFDFDGELQADAALVPEVGEHKAPGSKVAGHANVLIFPNLDAANIGYKMVQRFANATALGPLVQGLAKPILDLSRGCSTEDIADVVAVCCSDAISTDIMEKEESIVKKEVVFKATSFLMRPARTHWFSNCCKLQTIPFLSLRP